MTKKDEAERLWGRFRELVGMTDDGQVRREDGVRALSRLVAEERERAVEEEREACAKIAEEWIKRGSGRETAASYGNGIAVNIAADIRSRPHAATSKEKTVASAYIESPGEIAAAIRSRGAS